MLISSALPLFNDAVNVIVNVIKLTGVVAVVTIVWKLAAATQSIRLWAARVEDNHLHSIEVSTGETLKLLAVAIPAVTTALDELVSMRHDLHEHQLEDQEIQTAIKDQLIELRRDITILARE